MSGLNVADYNVRIKYEEYRNVQIVPGTKYRSEKLGQKVGLIRNEILDLESTDQSEELIWLED